MYFDLDRAQNYIMSWVVEHNKIFVENGWSCSNQYEKIKSGLGDTTLIDLGKMVSEEFVRIQNNKLSELLYTYILQEIEAIVLNKSNCPGDCFSQDGDTRSWTQKSMAAYLSEKTDNMVYLFESVTQRLQHLEDENSKEELLCLCLETAFKINAHAIPMGWTCEGQRGRASGVGLSSLSKIVTVCAENIVHHQLSVQSFKNISENMISIFKKNSKFPKDFAAKVWYEKDKKVIWSESQMVENITARFTEYIQAKVEVEKTFARLLETTPQISSSRKMK